MADKKVEITNEMCRQAQLLIKGGATNKEAGRFLGVSPATVSRIRNADYDLFKYLQNTEARRKAAGAYKCNYTGVCELPESGIELTPDGPRMKQDQVPGQVAMDLEKQEAGTYTPEIQDNQPIKLDISKEAFEYELNNRLMRFLGGKMGEITTKLDKLNDNLCQILRRMDK